MNTDFETTARVVLADPVALEAYVRNRVARGAAIKLYLDDIRGAPDDTWVLAQTAELARVVMLAVPVECASLDHDLGECDECAATTDAGGQWLIAAPTCEHRMTGYGLVKWMAENNIWPRFKPVVHSANPPGKANMVATIERYWAPPTSA